MASEDYTADLSVSTGILLCYSREMSFKIYNEFHFDFPSSFRSIFIFCFHVTSCIFQM